jgi:hypothetical protein
MTTTMTNWEYRTETVRGIFKLRSTKLVEIQRTCDTLGREGWELVGVSYDWFVVQYVLFFKRPKQALAST